MNKKTSMNNAKLPSWNNAGPSMMGGGGDDATATKEDATTTRLWRIPTTATNGNQMGMGNQMGNQMMGNQMMGNQMGYQQNNMGMQQQGYGMQQQGYPQQQQMGGMGMGNQMGGMGMGNQMGGMGCNSRINNSNNSNKVMMHLIFWLKKTSVSGSRQCKLVT